MWNRRIQIIIALICGGNNRYEEFMEDLEKHEIVHCLKTWKRECAKNKILGLIIDKRN